MPLVWGSMLVLLVTTTIFTALVVNNIGGGLEEGLVVGAVIGFGIAATNKIPHYSFAQQPWLLAILNAINTGLAITLSGVIIGAFNARTSPLVRYSRARKNSTTTKKGSTIVDPFLVFSCNWQRPNY